MNITFNELRALKHRLPTGSVKRIAEELELSEQTVRNYFGAKKYQDGEVIGNMVESGPDGGIVNIEDTRILDLAKKIVAEHEKSLTETPS